jgi:hypothetical protein
MECHSIATKGKGFATCGCIKNIASLILESLKENKLTIPDLIMEKRARMKILLVDANKNIPVSKINGILKEVLMLYK